MEDSQSILIQLQKKRAAIEKQLAVMQGMDELSGDDYEEEPEEDPVVPEEPEYEVPEEKEDEVPEEKEDEVPEEKDEPIVADYKSEDDDRLAKKIDSIIENKKIVRKCQKAIDKLIIEVKSQLDTIMDNLDDCKSITEADLQHLTTEYEELLEEFSLCQGDILEELPKGYTLSKAYISKMEKELDAIEADVNKYL